MFLSNLLTCCVSGLRDGGAADFGVGGRESRWVSEKQRPHGSFDQVGPRFFFASKFVLANPCVSLNKAPFPSFNGSQDILARLCDQWQTDEPKEHRPAQLPRPRLRWPVIAASPALLLCSKEVWRVWSPSERPASQRHPGTHTGKTEINYRDFWTNQLGSIIKQISQ